MVQAWTNFQKENHPLKTPQWSMYDSHVSRVNLVKIIQEFVVKICMTFVDRYAHILSALNVK